MRYYEHEGVQPETAHEAVRESYNGEELAKLVRTFVGAKPPPTRKEEMAAALARLLERDQLQRIWAKLNPEEQAMAAQTAWSETGFFDRQKFAASRESSNSGQEEDVDDEESDYEEDDDDVMFGFGRSKDGKRKRSLLELIMPRGVMPRDIQRRLRAIVSKPVPPAVVGVDSPPDSLQMTVHIWNAKTKSYGRGTEAVPIVRREMERAAWHDLMAMLRLVDAGKVPVTEKNRWPTPAAIRQIDEVLDGGDFYPDDKSSRKKSQDLDESPPGPIRAFAWPMLLQAGKLSQVRGSRLELTKAGRVALTSPPHETLRGLWNKWIDSDLLDELRRIDVIRGQTGAGKRGLTDTAQRRHAIEAALRDCPAGRWIALDEFSRHMRAAGHEFEVSSDPWSLYIAEQQYGSLGYEGYGGWNILQLRYLLCVLMEYAATLGLVDVAFVPPAGARPDYGSMWGTDDMAFFSRYDGFMFMRTTPLGAYALGLEGSYAPPPMEARKVIRVEPDLHVVATGPLTSADVLLLNTFARKTADDIWHLDPARFLDAEAAGRSAQELTEFLEAASGEDLPEPVDRFIAEVAARARALSDLGPARLIGCADPGLATFIANHPAARKVCSLAGADKLVVAAKDESAFHRALRQLGFTLRPASKT
ncbi:MAG TPA: hypothetical protein VH370_27150 [Humisphaera sp.]|jgi:hypothetical protein|nr:hypothetical protein [Humisphaera sp.]